MTGQSKKPWGAQFISANDQLYGQNHLFKRKRKKKTVKDGYRAMARLKSGLNSVRL